MSSARKELTGKDEGGPSRQFLTDVCRQIDKLSIPVGKKGRARLFESTPCGVFANTDEKLINDIMVAVKESCQEGEEQEQRNVKKNAQNEVKMNKKKNEGNVKEKAKNEDKMKKKAIEQAKLYTRAIGRIMLHALANKQTLPTSAMPPFLINCESNTVSFQQCFV